MYVVIQKKWCAHPWALYVFPRDHLAHAMYVFCSEEFNNSHVLKLPSSCATYRAIHDSRIASVYMHIHHQPSFLKLIDKMNAQVGLQSKKCAHAGIYLPKY